MGYRPVNRSATTATSSRITSSEGHIMPTRSWGSIRKTRQPLERKTARIR
ncbi:Uncharacterised protein [Mycobacterium tuberculosis]|uniref:Uncharacterized protein n=1 Tax=Mycobacterium tuberculosis TaxID=1773 RepID=A0A916PAC3_MYCTX|nr:Uncharacterised protein [Mycobacterium tuberculosis]